MGDDSFARTFAVSRNGDARLIRKVVSGEWYAETPLGRKRIHLNEAVEFARRLRASGGKVTENQPGGTSFYNLLNDVKKSRPVRITG